MKTPSELREMIADFVLGDSSKISYQLKLAKYSKLEQIDIRLNELESGEVPDDEDEKELVNDELAELYDEICKIINKK